MRGIAIVLMVFLLGCSPSYTVDNIREMNRNEKKTILQYCDQYTVDEMTIYNFRGYFIAIEKGDTLLVDPYAMSYSARKLKKR